jgi:AraC-like DNA-binding protein
MGDLVAFHPGVTHQETFLAGANHLICIRFEPDRISLPLPDGKHLQSVIRLPWPHRFRNLFDQMVSELEQRDRWSQTIIGTYLVQFAILLWRAIEELESGKQGKNNYTQERIAFVKELINAHFDSPIDLAALASNAFMSKSRFSHAFKKIAGTPPKKYFINRKVYEARCLLATSSMPVSRIALKVGYDDPKYFSRIFRKINGCSPLQFRKKQRQSTR